MQKNAEIGKIKQDVPILVARAVHHFIRDLTQNCAEISRNKGKTGHCQNYKLTKEHVKEAIDQIPKYKFLRKIVEDIQITPQQQETFYVVKGKNNEAETQYLGKKRNRANPGQDYDDNEEFVYQGGLSYMYNNSPNN